MMVHLKKTGAILLIGLLAAQVVGITAASVRTDGEKDGSDLVGAGYADGQSAQENILLADSLRPDDLPIAPDSASDPLDESETTEEIKVGGYQSGRTDSDVEVTTPQSSAPQTQDSDPVTAPATDATPTTDPQTGSDAPATETPTTETPTTVAPETQPPETGSPAAPPVAPLTDEGQGGLYAIANPDPNYGYKVVSVTGSERDLLERLVMGEAGDQGYIGAAMVAQCIKDAMTYEGYKSVSAVRKGMKYSGSISRQPNSDVKKAVAYIFDEGGYAVQHPILYFYYSGNGINRNGFHESQEFVVQYRDHRYFWKR